jgi:DNA-binding NarL/FixJ family response regulator
MLPDAGAAAARPTAARRFEAPRPPAPACGRHDLTPRELEVLALLVAGQSDGEIAQSLFISKNTASVHVAAIKGKLGSRSRIEIANDAIGLGLVERPKPVRR